MNIAYILTMFRTVIYLFAGVEAIGTFFLYQYGYNKLKPTKIINKLSYLFLSLGILMLYLAFIPFSLITNTKVFSILTGVLIIFIIPVYYFIREFRMESIKDDGKKTKSIK